MQFKQQTGKVIVDNVRLLLAGFAFAASVIQPSVADAQAQVVLLGAPVGTTTDANPEIQVSAPNAVSYRYSINDGPYSPAVPVTTPIALTGVVGVGGQQYTAGSAPLADVLALKYIDDSFAEFFDRVTFEHLESQVQVTYMVNKLRTAVGPDNVLNLRGADVAALNATMHETVPAGPKFELSSLAIRGGELSSTSRAAGIRTFVLSVPPRGDTVLVTPQVNNGQTAIVINGQSVTSGQTVYVPAPTDGSTIVVETRGPDGAVMSYTITVRYDERLTASSYGSFYLRAFAPSSAYVSLQNAGSSTATYGLTFNQKFGLTLQGLIDEIAGMAPEYPDEPDARKVWRFVRDNRYHFWPLTRARWNQSPALFFSSIGFGFCDDSAALFYHLMTAMGYPARVWALSGRHSVPEAFINGRWELWDPDLQVYYQNRDGLVAGVEELANDTDLVRHPLSMVVGALDSAYGEYVASIYGTHTDTYVVAGAGSLPLLNDASMQFDIPPGGTFEFPGVFDGPLSALDLERVPSYANARLIVPAGFSGSVSMPLVVQSVGWSNHPRLSVIVSDGSGKPDSQPTVATWALDVESPYTVATQPSGVYNPIEPVTLTAVGAAAIYYTTDGSLPTGSSQAYSAPIAFAPGTTVRFFAVDSVGNRERVRSYGPRVERVLVRMSSLADTLAFSASAEGGAGAYEYSFRFYAPGSGWSTVRPYSESDHWEWNRTGAPKGRYTVEVTVRNRGTTGRVDAFADLAFDVVPGAVPTNRAPTLTNPGDQTSRTDGYHQAVLADRPTAYWRFDEVTGPTATDIAGVSPGTLVGGVTPGQPGPFTGANTAMRFDGSTGFVQVASTPALQLAGDLTIELWVNVSLATRQTLISKGYLHEFELTLETDGRLNLYQGDGSTSWRGLSAFGAVAANTWQHIVVTRTTATKTVRFYVNGAAAGSRTDITPPTPSTLALSIGRTTGRAQHVNGLLDEAALYDSALSPAQILNHYSLHTFAGGGVPVALQLHASDPEGDALTYGVMGLPPGLAINATTGLISGTLIPSSNGTYQVTATASDKSASTSQTFTWTVMVVDGS